MKHHYRKRKREEKWIVADGHLHLKIQELKTLSPPCKLTNNSYHENNNDYNYICMVAWLMAVVALTPKSRVNYCNEKSMMFLAWHVHVWGVYHQFRIRKQTIIFEKILFMIHMVVVIVLIRCCRYCYYSDDRWCWIINMYHYL